ncbi:hypothetical protein IWZ00DRAFT_349905, partial [Phyllosticta capitalensis]
RHSKIYNLRSLLSPVLNASGSFRLTWRYQILLQPGTAHTIWPFSAPSPDFRSDKQSNTNQDVSLSTTMPPIFKNTVTGLSHSRVPKKRILVGMDSETNTLIWSDMFPYFYTSSDGLELIPLCVLTKPTIRFQPPFDSIKFDTAEDRTNALRLFRRIWRIVFPEVAQVHHSGQGHRVLMRAGTDEQRPAVEYVERIRRAGKKLPHPFDRLDLETDEDAEHALLVFEET